MASKQKVEDELTETLEDIKEHLPNLIVYEQIYRNAVLGRKIAAVYKGVIFFARETTKYYVANHGYSKALTPYSPSIVHLFDELTKITERWGKALGGKQAFYASNSSFKKDLLAVKNQCEVLLSVNVDKLKKLAEGSSLAVCD